MIGRRHGVINARLHNTDDGSLVIDLWEGEDSNADESMGRIRFKAGRLLVEDARTVHTGVNWRSVAQRMDDAYNAGEPSWSRLTDAEIRALCHDDVRHIPAEVQERRSATA